MKIKNYYNSDQGKILISRNQASQFAKQIAHDFNPLHDVDAKRFCVPGDLLLAMVLNEYGLSRSTEIIFSGMVSDNIVLHLPQQAGKEFFIQDEQGKDYLTIKRHGEICHDSDKIHALVRVYVEFSGQTFLQILVPLMKQANVMINPDRPLIIYHRMSIQLDHFDFEQPELKLKDQQLTVKGKRGEMALFFDIHQKGQIIGHGQKNMVLSGLRPYHEPSMQRLINDYLAKQK